MRILLIYLHTRRCGGYHYARGFRQLKHDVVTAGPWAPGDFGTPGREPDHELPPSNKFSWNGGDFDFLPDIPDLTVLIDGGQDLRVSGIPGPWVHISTEGTNMEWSDTPYKYAEIMRAGNPPEVKWLPKAFDYYDAPRQTEEKIYDLVQLASPRAARTYLWEYITKNAPDLNCLFGEIWGPVYHQAYRFARCTFVASGVDFVTNRVFEAMAAGCVVIADRTPSMLSLFEPAGDSDHEHFVDYTAIEGPGGEAMPDPDWLITKVRELKEDIPIRRSIMATRARQLVLQRDSFTDRCREILEGCF